MFCAAGYNARRQCVLAGKTPNQVVAERRTAKPALAKDKPAERSGPCDITKTRLTADRAKEVSQPDSVSVSRRCSRQPACGWRARKRRHRRGAAYKPGGLSCAREPGTPTRTGAGHELENIFRSDDARGPYDHASQRTNAGSNHKTQTHDHEACGPGRREVVGQIRFSRTLRAAETERCAASP
jgi:hypothetical protein